MSTAMSSGSTFSLMSPAAGLAPCCARATAGTRSRIESTRMRRLLSAAVRIHFRAMVKINGRTLGAAACAVMTIVTMGLAAARQAAPPDTLTVTLTGQSMLRSDLRATAPKAVPVIAGLLKGDVVFTNFEGAIALPGQSASEGRGFLAPPEALDAFKAMGFNLLSLSNNHAFDMQATGIRNTIAEANRRQIVHAGIGNTLAEATAPAYLKTPKGT